jgi:hypothetical protein
LELLRPNTVTVADTKVRALFGCAFGYGQAVVIVQLPLGLVLIELSRGEQFCGEKIDFAEKKWSAAVFVRS